jgi:hypothetical protein
MKMCPLNRGVRSWGVSVNRDFTVFIIVGVSRLQSKKFLFYSSKMNKHNFSKLKCFNPKLTTHVLN